MRAKFGRGAVRRPCRKKARLNFRPNEHVYERTTYNNPLNPPPTLGWGGSIFVVKLRVSIGVVLAKFGRGPTFVSKKSSFKFISRSIFQYFHLLSVALNLQT